MLRTKVISGGIILTLRTLLGIGVSIIGSILILRHFDPKTYGLYSLAFYWISFLTLLVQFGINTYLIRTPEPITDRLTSVALTLFLIQATIGVIFILAVFGPLISLFYKEKNFYLMLALLSSTYILNSFGMVSLCLLERNFEYGKLGMLELTTQIFYYVPALIFAKIGLGIFALILAELTRSLFTSVGAFLFKKIRFRVVWDKELVLKMIKYGFGITTSSGIYTINAAIVPILVGKIVGTEAVGIIRVSQNIVGQLSFFKSIAWRISVPALGKIQNETQKVIKVVSEGSIYQYFLVALPLLGFASIGYWLIPILFGNKWNAVSAVIIVSCLPVAVNAIFALQSSALYVAGKNFDVAKWTIAYTLLLWPIAFVTITRFGYIGLPLAEILVLPTYYILHRVFKKHFGSPGYKDVFIFLAISYLVTISAWFVKIPWISLLAFTIPTCAMILCRKNSRQVILELLHYFKNGVLSHSFSPFISK